MSEGHKASHHVLDSKDIKAAQRVMAQVRDILREGEITLKGKLAEDTKAEKRIAQMTKSMQAFQDLTYAIPFRDLQKKFYKLAEKAGQAIPEEQYPAVACVLGQEFWDNMRTFRLTNAPERAVMLTIYNGSAFRAVLTDPAFEMFQGNGSMIEFAAQKYPVNPFGYLQDLKRNVENIMTWDCYRDTAIPESTFVWACFKNPSNPEAYIRKHSDEGRKTGQDQDNTPAL